MDHKTGKPLVTIILPTIGRPAYIVDTIRSILAQSYSNLEILISDNAPDVATEELLTLAGIFDHRFKFITRTSRLNFSDHMNACIADAQGKYLMILSDDDQITPGYIDEMVEAMESMPNIAVGLGRQIRITEDVEGVIIDRPMPEFQKVVGGIDFLKGSLSSALATGVLTYISLFARKVDILQVGGFKKYPDGSHADNFILFSLALRGDIMLGCEVMFYRVYLSSSGLATPFESLLDATRAYFKDCNALLQNSSKIVTYSDVQIITRLLKKNNSGLLMGRMRRVYMRKSSILTSMINFIKIVNFKLLD